MKIAYVTSTFPYGVGEEFLAAEINELAHSLGDLIVIPLYPRGKIKSSWKEEGAISSASVGLLSMSVIAGFIEYSLSHPIRIWHALFFLLRHSRFDRKLIKNLSVIPKAAWLAKVASKKKINHIHAHWGGVTSSMVMLSCHMSGIPWSITCHRWDIYENNLLGLKSKNASFIRFISNRGAKDSMKYDVEAEKIDVIPMGVAIDRMPPVRSLGGGVLRIMCAANLIEVKGHKYLLEAVSILKGEGKKISLSIAGVGPLIESLREMALSLDLAQEVTFLGHIAHSELMKSYEEGAVDLFVLPSIELDPVNHEGVPVSLMEAMSFGIPCISTQTGSIQELLTEELENTVPQQNARAIAEKIDQFISDPDFYMRVSRLGGEILMSNWTSKISAQRLLERIRETRLA